MRLPCCERQGHRLTNFAREGPEAGKHTLSSYSAPYRVVLNNIRKNRVRHDVMGGKPGSRSCHEHKRETEQSLILVDLLEIVDEAPLNNACPGDE